jgi:hypothetical protein
MEKKDFGYLLYKYLFWLYEIGKLLYELKKHNSAKTSNNFPVTLFLRRVP